MLHLSFGTMEIIIIIISIIIIIRNNVSLRCAENEVDKA